MNKRQHCGHSPIQPQTRSLIQYAPHDTVSEILHDCIQKLNSYISITLHKCCISNDGKPNDHSYNHSYIPKQQIIFVLDCLFSCCSDYKKTMMSSLKSMCSSNWTPEALTFSISQEIRSLVVTSASKPGVHGANSDGRKTVSPHTRHK